VVPAGVAIGRLVIDTRPWISPAAAGSAHAARLISPRPTSSKYVHQGVFIVEGSFVGRRSGESSVNGGLSPSAARAVQGPEMPPF